MTGAACSCHDPGVFGHQERCRLGLGPRAAGGHAGHGAAGGPPIAGIDYEASYGAAASSGAAAWWLRSTGRLFGGLDR